MPNSNQRYHTIFLDVGGTLLRAHPSVGAIYAEVARRHDIHLDAKVVEKRMREHFFVHKGSERDKHFTQPHTLSPEVARDFWRELVRVGLGPDADTPRFDPFFEDVFNEFACGDRYCYFPEVERVLARLESAGYRLGLISNWDDRLRRICTEMKLHERFDPIVISAEVGSEKPHREIFDAARDLCGAGPGDLLLQVGDSRRDDYEGAIAAGFHARLVNRMAGETLETALHDLLESDNGSTD